MLSPEKTTQLQRIEEAIRTKQPSQDALPVEASQLQQVEKAIAAKKRSDLLLPGSGFHRTAEGQLQYRPKPTKTQALGSHFAENVVLGGTSKIVTGVTTLLPDIAAALGSKKAAKVSDTIRKNIPQVPPETTLQDLGQTLMQYGLPAAKTMQLFNGLASNTPSYVRFLGSVMTGAATDVVVAAEGDATLADMIRVNSPTKIQKTDTAFEKRIKIGAEGAVIGGVVGELAVLGGQAIKKLRPKTLLHNAVVKALGDQAINVDDAITELNKILKTDNIVDYTSGIASKDIGLVGLEQGIITKGDSSVIFQARKNGNLHKISGALEDIVQRNGGDAEKARLAFRTHFNDLLDTAQDTVTKAEDALTASKLETDYFIDDWVSGVTGQENASSVIDSAVKDTLNNLTRKKNALFAAIDPNGSLIIENKEPWRMLLADMQRATSAGDMTPKQLPTQIMSAFNKMLVKGKKSKPLMYRALVDIRPSLVSAIRDSKSGSGEVTRRLVELKNAIDGYPVELAESFAHTSQGARAKEAISFYRNEFVPKFGNLVGRQFRIASKREAFAPSITGRKFLKNPNGFQETSMQLRGILEASSEKEQALDAVREFFIGDVAELLRGSKGSKAASKLQIYLDKRGTREALSHFPETRKELHSFKAGLTKKITKENDFTARLALAKTMQKQTEKEMQLSATRFFVNKTPIKAVGAIMRGGDPAHNMRELVKLAQNDKSGDAFIGLRAAMGQHLTDTLTGSKSIKDKLQVSHAKLVKMLDTPDTLAAVKQLYSPADIDQFKKMRKHLDDFELINMQGTSQSITKSLSEKTQQARILLASMYGIVKGKGVFTLSKWVLQAIGADPVAKINVLLDQVFLDPELLKTLLKEHKTVGAQKKAALKIKRTLLNNFYPGREEEIQPAP